MRSAALTITYEKCSTCHQKTLKIFETITMNDTYVLKLSGLFVLIINLV
jgi:hypothetical protein